MLCIAGKLGGAAESPAAIDEAADQPFLQMQDECSGGRHDLKVPCTLGEADSDTSPDLSTQLTMVPVIFKRPQGRPTWG
jgi:hypothetical protein